MQPLTLHGHTFDWGARTYVMGILNLTTDSFSGDGLAGADDLSVEHALARGLRFAQEGADILDVGGESTRPGAQPVSAEQEMAQVVPVVQASGPRAGPAHLGGHLQSQRGRGRPASRGAHHQRCMGPQGRSGPG